MHTSDNCEKQVGLRSLQNEKRHGPKPRSRALFSISGSVILRLERYGRSRLSPHERCSQETLLVLHPIHNRRVPQSLCDFCARVGFHNSVTQRISYPEKYHGPEMNSGPSDTKRRLPNTYYDKSEVRNVNALTIAAVPRFYVRISGIFFALTKRFRSSSQLGHKKGTAEAVP